MTAPESPAPEAGAVFATPPTTLTLAGVREGMLDMAPVAVLVIPFGLGFGVAASQKGLEWWLSTLMSAVTCAGASQFAALDLWAAPLPVLPILITVLVVNARHLLYGAAIYTWLKDLTPVQRFPILAVMTDSNWAYAMSKRAKGAGDAGLLLGSGLALWIVWIASTAAGATLGSGIGNPKTFGLDVVMIAFFAANLAGLWRGREDMVPWLAAAVGALAGLWLLPPGWHVLSGAAAGGIAGVLADDA